MVTQTVDTYFSESNSHFRILEGDEVAATPVATPVVTSVESPTGDAGASGNNASAGGNVAGSDPVDSGSSGN